MKAAKKLTNIAPEKSMPDLAAEYRKKDTDPLMLRAVMLMKTSEQNMARICRKSGVSYTCVRQWQLGKTKRPQAATLRFILRVMGYDLTITPKR